MRRVYGRILANQFAKQGAEVCGDIEDILRDPYNTYSSTWTPTNVLEAVRVSANLVRAEKQLASQKIRKTPHIATDTPANTLVDIINASVDGAHLLSPSASKKMEVPNSCAEAESYFFEVIEELEQLEPSMVPENVLQIIHAEGQALILRKKYEVSSGLTLAKMQIDGIPYPAGSIVAVRTKRIKQRPGEQRQINVELSEIDKITFMRLSAFALRPEERSKSFPMRELTGYDSEQTDAYAAITMGDIGKTVSEALLKLTAVE